MSAGPGTPAVSARGLWVRAGARTLLADVAFDAGGGQLVAIVGASGSGKSTLLRALAGRLPRGLSLSAEALGWSVDGRPAPPPWPGVVVTHLPQEAGVALDPFRPVGQQVDADHLREVGFDPATAARVAAARPHTLSGGMAERAAVAQALARRSPALLCDEPTTGLDRAVRRTVLDALRRHADRGHLVVVVTHDRPAVARVADRILGCHDGRLEAA